jgi:hypothetical protein
MIYYIYKLVCKDISIKELYIGSTTHFIKRKYNHKSSCCNVNHKNYNFYVYRFIRDNGGWENWHMIEVEKYVAIDKHDAHRREREVMESLNATLNKSTPFLTPDESIERKRNSCKTIMYKKYNTDEEYRTKKHLYYIQNKEIRKEYQKQYYTDSKSSSKNEKTESI